MSSKEFRVKFLERLSAGLYASREKDVACDLLDEFGLPHRVASRAGRGTFGLARELLVRDAAIWRMAGPSN